jgi:hypothetical protein
MRVYVCQYVYWNAKPLPPLCLSPIHIALPLEIKLDEAAAWQIRTNATLIPHRGNRRREDVGSKRQL